jgi:hypothetical protein
MIKFDDYGLKVSIMTEVSGGYQPSAEVLGSQLPSEGILEKPCELRLQFIAMPVSSRIRPRVI